MEVSKDCNFTVYEVGQPEPEFKAGDEVSFIDRDGVKHTGVVREVDAVGNTIIDFDKEGEAAALLTVVT